MNPFFFLKKKNQSNSSHILKLILKLVLFNNVFVFYIGTVVLFKPYVSSVVNLNYKYSPSN